MAFVTATAAVHRFCCLLVIQLHASDSTRQSLDMSDARKSHLINVLLIFGQYVCKFLRNIELNKKRTHVIDIRMYVVSKPFT